jgi:hypothetical protein
VEYLEALEGDASLGAFPSPTYARLFLRTYARYLDLDEETLVEAFTQRHGADPVPVSRALLQEAPRRSLGRARSIDDTRFTGAFSPLKRSSWRSRLRIERLARRSKVLAPGKAGVPSGLPAPWLLVGTGLVVVLIASAVFVSTRHHEAPDPPRQGAVVPPGPQLPRGGTAILPRYRVVAFYGTARTERLGVLGAGTPDQEARKLLRQTRIYRYDRPVLPVFELIATVASFHPGDDGKYRFRQPPEVIQAYLDAIRKVKGLLVLDIQPGRGDFMSEVRRYGRFLQEPDVGLALDGEWHVGPKEVPGVTIGSIDAVTINRAEAYVSDIVSRFRLPQKLFVIHQFTPGEVKKKQDIVRDPPGLAVVLDIDGFGAKLTKVSKYNLLTGERDGFFHGVKLYYGQDPDLMTAQDVLGLRPTPDVVIYQ